MKGSRTKLRPNPALKTISVAVTSSSPKTIASSARRGVHATVPGALQLRISGVKINMPQASPCHQVHQFDTRSAAVIG